MKFALADRMMLMRVVRYEIAQVQQTQQAHAESDVNALAAANRQLEPDAGAPPTNQEQLDAAVAAASPLVRTQIFSRARDQRHRAWKAGDKPRMERTIPVFRALIAADTDRRFHRNHGQLGFALKDKAQPDLAAAEAALTDAIEIRDKERETGFLLYELSRAIARILQHGPNPPPPERMKIEADLKAAEQSRFLQRQIAAGEFDEIRSFRAGTP